MNKKNLTTSWDKSADWYHDHLEKSGGTYHSEVILPNLFRLIAPKKEHTILDIACGQGFFVRKFHAAGTRITGVDISKKLIGLAKKNSPRAISFYVSPAHSMPFIPNASIDIITIILAIQNIKNIQDVFKECYRILKNNGHLYLVLNHPVFRVPHQSSWGWDPERKIQYRRIDRYLSELKVSITMHPGNEHTEHTLTFHRPLQSYVKHLSKNDLVITRLEEWISHKTSEAGPRREAENRTRHEFPLFCAIETKKL